MTKDSKQPEPQPERVFTSKEIMEMSFAMADRHAIFYTLWNVGKPRFDSNIKTAAVRFNPEGDCIDFLINPTFWDGLNQEQKEFVFAHECLHVLSNHGLRSRNAENHELANIAMDVVVNETLIQGFGFNKDIVDPQEEYCWFGKTFADHADVEEGQAYEYYYTALNELDAMEIGAAGETVDGHEGLGDLEIPKSVVDAIADGLTDEEKQDLMDKMGDLIEDGERAEAEENEDGDGHGSEAGHGLAGALKVMPKVYVKPKRKWETVITRWTKKHLKEELKPEESWIRANRRLVGIPDAALLPTEHEDFEERQKGRIEIYAFLDVSGSCEHLAERFWKVLNTIPKKRFDVRPRVFADRVGEVDMERNQFPNVGYGTAFDILERHIQGELRSGEIKRYPDAVFVITDGAGNNVHPGKPENWHVFLTPHGSRNNFPNGVHFYDLAKFE